MPTKKPITPVAAATAAKYEVIDIKKLVSKSNPRGEVTKADVADLAESIRQKGILEPLIVRPDGDMFEVVAGGRRLLAAKVAGLTEVPCSVREMDDAEAGEIAIIENLHRADVHPLDEAAAYAALAKTMSDIKSVAARVGKPAAHVVRRMKLLTLGDKARESYRSGKLSDDRAEVVAELESEDDQVKAVKYVIDNPLSTARELSDWIDDDLAGCLKRQPWLKDADAMRAVGACTKCPDTRNTLFGTATADECVSSDCWRVKMRKYLDYLKSKRPRSVLINRNGRSDFGSKPSWQFESAAKDKCEYAVDGIDIYTFAVSKVCFSKLCARHRHTSVSVPLSPAAKAKQEAAAAARKAAQEKEEKKKNDAMLKVIQAAASWPPTRHAMAVAIEAVAGNNCDVEDVMKRHGIRREDSMSSDQETKFILEHVAAAKSDAEVWAILLDFCVNESYRGEKLMKKLAGNEEEKKPAKASKSKKADPDDDAGDDDEE